MFFQFSLNAHGRDTISTQLKDLNNKISESWWWFYSAANFGSKQSCGCDFETHHQPKHYSTQSAITQWACEFLKFPIILYTGPLLQILMGPRWWISMSLLIWWAQLLIYLSKSGLTVMTCCISVLFPWGWIPIWGSTGCSSIIRVWSSISRTLNIGFDIIPT